MPDYHKISFCTVAMDRLHHVKLTLKKNIKDNEKYPALEFILLDYNSSDGLQQWVMDEMSSYVESGILKYYRTTEPDFLNRSHSANMSFKLANGNILCRVDADNYIGPDFAAFVNQQFSGQEKIFLTPNFERRDVIGRLCIRSSDFYSFRGYNESFEGYGFEDLELYQYLFLNGLSHNFITDYRYLDAIYHGHDERFAKEYIGKMLLEIYVSYLEPWKAEILLLYKDSKYERGTVIDSESVPGTMETTDTITNKINLEKSWEKGTWRPASNGDGSQYSELDHLIINLSASTSISSISGEQMNFYKITDQNLRNDIMLLRSELENREKFYNTTISAVDERNLNGFGIGLTVKMN